MPTLQERIGVLGQQGYRGIFVVVFAHRDEEDIQLVAADPEWCVAEAEKEVARRRQGEPVTVDAGRLF